MTIANQNAYPIADSGGDALPGEIGLTKRECFAAAALQGLLAKGEPIYVAAGAAVQAADKLIIELEKTTAKTEGEG